MLLAAEHPARCDTLAGCAAGCVGHQDYSWQLVVSRDNTPAKGKICWLCRLRRSRYESELVAVLRQSLAQDPLGGDGEQLLCKTGQRVQ